MGGDALMEGSGTVVPRYRGTPVPRYPGTSDTDFLWTEVKQGSSAGWKSIIWGRELLSLRIRWKMGNGSRILAFEDPWIPRPHSLRPVSQSPDGKGNDEPVSWVTNLLADFQNSRIALIAPPLAYPPIKEAWQSPPVGTLKLNTDASVFQGRDVFEIEAIIRNDKGEVIIALSKLASGGFSVEVCEAIALREGLWLAKQHGLKVDWVKVDADNVVAGVRCFKPSNNCASFVFDDIFGLCKDFGVSECQAIYRCGNGVAYNLTSLAISSLRDIL
ncbi:hypothetical protein Dsin_025637 [Dipteronia sinensis]|uniref:RNase H type-1 domain-containing protein n=1 Tax=Dipteronia sinensis TaxID=43782 RepID=A0AAE0DX55_9ROSI|nr:hypothetical protein Dsin_025637 [Dipteronia sinensis]